MSEQSKTSIRAGAVLAALIVALPGSFAAAQEIAFERYTLDNGLTVILHEDRHHTILCVAYAIFPSESVN